jgi:ADP-ribosyl-[dinitrogen reductase] hydrolase
VGRAQRIGLTEAADTTGAICWQLAGAYWGESGIPKEWLDELVRREMIERAVAQLLSQQGPERQKTRL